MKKIFFLTSIILNLFLVCFFMYKKSDSIVCQNNETTFQDGVAKKFRIAIVTPVSHPALNNIEDSFRKNLNAYKDCSFECETFNANGNEMLMRAQIEEIIQKKYDLIFSIASHATQLAKEITLKRSHEIPIVFGAVADPVRLGLVKSESSSGNHVTGTAATTNYPDQVKLLLALKPDLKNVLLVYDPTQSSGLERDKNEIEGLFKKQNVKLHTIEIYQTSEIHQKVASLIDCADVVMTLKDNTVSPGIDALITMCNRYGKTLFVSDLNEVRKGAVLGFGFSERSFGKNAAPLVYRILIEGKHPSSVPIHIVNEFKLHINADYLKQQNVIIDDSQLFLFKAVSVI